MTFQRRNDLFQEVTKKMMDTMVSKAADYSNEDSLSNFKAVANICQLTPEQVCLTMIGVKVARLGVLLQGKKPNNESIEDSILDLQNYSFLLYCIRQEIIDSETQPTCGQDDINEYITSLNAPRVI